MLLISIWLSRVTYQMLQAVITRLMHPEVISIRYFWYRFAIAAVGLAGFFICLTSGIIITREKDQISAETNVTASKGWGRSNKDWTTVRERQLSSPT